MADFASWDHGTLARFAHECNRDLLAERTKANDLYALATHQAEELERLRADNKALLVAWRKAVAESQQTVA